jgi:uncharacterized membrane protein
MAPLITLVVVTVLARLAGALKLGRGYFATLPAALCAGVAAMFLLTGGAHFIGLRADLMRMVPPGLGNPGFWVTLTGVAEVAGAIGILIPATRRLAAVGLLLLLLAVFPANVICRHAANHVWRRITHALGAAQHRADHLFGRSGMGGLRSQNDSDEILTQGFQLSKGCPLLSVAADLRRFGGGPG